MKKYFLTMFILILAGGLSILFSFKAYGNEYYISISGNNHQSGTSVQPFRTIQKCADVAQAGDNCIIHEGTYRETVVLKNSGKADSPVTFKAVLGEKVIISGADLITGWTLYNGNIYVANTKFSLPPTQLYVDGNFYDIAHYPQNGYLIATSDSSDTKSIIDSDLALTSNQILGTTVITRSVPWYLNSNVAIAYDNITHKITLNGNLYGSQKMRTQYGFYLQNMLWMLNSPGEWFYDSSAKKIYLCTTNKDNPNNHTIEVSNRSNDIYDNGKNYITIQNLTIANANQNDISVNNANNVNLISLNILGGLLGIQSDNMKNSTISNNSIRNTLSNGVRLNNSNNVKIVNNTVNNAGNVGKTPKQSNGGLTVLGTNSNVSIKNNTVTNSGYNGIYYYGDKILVQSNIVDKSCLILDDCGGIYTSNANDHGWKSTIRGNTVKNSIGNFSGTAYSKTQAEGIYLDDLSHDYIVINNNVYNVDSGIYIHTGYNNTVTGNSVFSARKYGFRLTEDNFGGFAKEVSGTVRNNVVTDNVFETIANGNGPVDYYSKFGTITNFGTFNSNQYCHPNTNYAVTKQEMNSSVNYTLSDWQKTTGQDLNSIDSNSYCSHK